jgi:hypothetical protein
MESLVGNDDFYAILYLQLPDVNVRTTIGSWRYVWDLDRAFNLATTSSLWGNGGRAGTPTACAS